VTAETIVEFIVIKCSVVIYNVRLKNYKKYSETAVNGC